MRFAILGNSGSGKTSLAAALATDANLPRLDLDTVAWEPDRPAVARAEALAVRAVHEFCRSTDAWVIEGCYERLVAAALEHGPTLIFLNPGLEACLNNCRSRPWEPHKYPSEAEQQARLEFLLSWVADYYTRTGPMSLSSHRACFDAYPGPKRELNALPAYPVDLAWMKPGT